MLSVLIVAALVYPFVYVIRRFFLKEPKFTGDVDGNQDTVPVKWLIAAVAIGLAILATAIQILLGNTESSVLSATIFLTLTLTYQFMRK